MVSKVRCLGFPFLSAFQLFCYLCRLIYIFTFYDITLGVGINPFSVYIGGKGGWSYEE